MTATCETCRFCHALPAEPARGPLSPSKPHGWAHECRRHAPAFHPDRFYADWPFVKATEDWCGEHDPRPVDPRLTCPGCGALANEAHKVTCTVVFSGISG